MKLDGELECLIYIDNSIVLGANVKNYKEKHNYFSSH